MTLMRRANVLAVDDQRANLIALDSVLGNECTMFFANSGYEAISILEERQDIDVVLMDLQMPGMDGFETASQIKRLKGCQDIPVVFITAVYNEDPYIKQGYKVGAVDYFSKPFDPEILRVKVGIYASFRQRAELLKERERQIRHSEELQRVGRELSALLKGLRVGVIVLDKTGRVTKCNEQLSTICTSGDRTQRESLIDTLGWWDADGNLIQGEIASLTAALHEGEELNNEYIKISCPMGSVKTILCSASPLRGLDGQIAGAVFVVQDFTERLTIEKDLESRIAKLVSSYVEAEAA